MHFSYAYNTVYYSQDQKEMSCLYVTHKQHIYSLQSLQKIVQYLLKNFQDLKLQAFKNWQKLRHSMQVKTLIFTNLVAKSSVFS